MLTQYFGFSALEIMKYVSEDLFRNTIIILNSEHDVKKIYSIKREFEYYRILYRDYWPKTIIAKSAINDNNEQQFTANITNVNNNGQSEDLEIINKKFKKLQLSTKRTEEEEKYLDEIIFSGEYKLKFMNRLRLASTKDLITVKYADTFLNDLMPHLKKFDIYLDIIDEVLEMKESRTTYLGRPIYNININNNYWFYDAIDKLVTESFMETDTVINMMEETLSSGTSSINFDSITLRSFIKEYKLDDIDTESYHNEMEELYELLKYNFSTLLSRKELSYIRTLFKTACNLERIYLASQKELQDELEYLGIYTVNVVKTNIFLKILSSCTFIHDKNMVKSFDKIYESLSEDRQLIKRYLYNRNVSIGSIIEQQEEDLEDGIQ